MYSYYGPQSTSVEQPGMTFQPQTSQWVATSSDYKSTSVSQYSQSQPLAATSYYGNNDSNETSQQNKRIPPPNPVASYSTYYQGWKALADGVRQAPGVTKEWAEYYANLSSTAAHFFHQNPQAQCATFDLPPAPPTEPASINNTTFQHSVGQSHGQSTRTNYVSSFPQQQHRNIEQPSKTTANAPMTYEAYMQANLKNCRTEKQREEMQQKLQEVIQQAVVDGTLQRDWSKEALIPVSLISSFDQVSASQPNLGSPSYGGPNTASAGAAPNNSSGQKRPRPHVKGSDKKKRRWDSSSSNASSNASYYGPSDGGAGTKSMQKNSYNSKLPENDSYYGPSSSTVSTSTNPIASAKKISPLTSSIVSPKNKNSQASKSKNKKWQRNSSGFDKSDSTLSERARRFAAPAVPTTNSFDEDDIAAQGPIVKGTCQILEKDYLRLTSAPRPELVRPKPILEMHLANLLAERKNEERRRDYLWFCSQFKAVRQDLTVQHIRDSFTVKVYETHARVALEEGDLNEYNQCQTQLKYLYEHFESETSEEAKKSLENRDEFVALRMLYSVFLTQNEKYQGGSSDLLKLLQSLTATQRQHPAIKFANRVRTAVAEGNYHLFFASLNNEDGGTHAGYLLQRLVPAMRKVALPRILGAYRPTSVPVAFVLEELVSNDNDYGKKWLQSCGCVFSKDGEQILCKDSEYKESDLEEKKSLI